MESGGILRVLDTETGRFHWVNAVHKKVLQDQKHRARFQLSAFDGRDEAAEGGGGNDDGVVWDENFDENTGYPYWVNRKSG